MFPTRSKLGDLELTESLAQNMRLYIKKTNYYENEIQSRKVNNRELMESNICSAMNAKFVTLNMELRMCTVTQSP